MRYRKLTSDGDYTFGNGQENFYRDNSEAVAQAVQTRLLLWLGEWFLDTEEGTPYLQAILGKHDEETRNNVIRNRIIETEGVLQLINYASVVDPDNRSVAVSCEISTIYGTSIIQVQL